MRKIAKIFTSIGIVFSSSLAIKEDENYRHDNLSYDFKSNLDLFDLREYSKYMSNSHLNWLNQMLENLKWYFARINSSKPLNVVYLHKMENSSIMAVWMKSDGEYFTHIYDEDSIHKGAKLHVISNDLINIYQDAFKFPALKGKVENRDYAIFGSVDNDKGFEKYLDFSYSFDQPDIALLTIMHGRENAQMIVERGVGFRRPNGEHYKGMFYDQNEKTFFKDYPKYKKYLHSVNDAYDSNFEILYEWN